MIIISNQQRDQIIKYLREYRSGLRGMDDRTRNKRRMLLLLLSKILKKPTITKPKISKDDDGNL